jgi:hypothetical protein
MGYTRRKIRSINRSFFLAGLVLAGWGLACAWLGWPRAFHHGGAAAFGLFLLAALFLFSFPLIWARYPEKHPVNHELHRYGRVAEISARLDADMAGAVEITGPFRFTSGFLVYDAGHEFQLVPYDQIASAEIEKSGDDVAGALVIRTRKGRRRQWYPGWMTGRFNPEEVLARVRAAAHLDQAPSPSRGAGKESA